ncbi:MAG: hypothetical protein AAFR61_22305 [Bacteroidota bacterium]
MGSQLNFICPTDHLESIISHTFGGTHYFLSSLGNSLAFDLETLEKIEELILEKNIRKVSFFLSDDNQILSDALSGQSLKKLVSLPGFYDQINQKKARSEELWTHNTSHSFIISYHLKQKINELTLRLGDPYFEAIDIEAKIYKRQKNLFQDIYPDLILQNQINLN